MMRNIIPILVVAMAAFLGLIDAGNLDTYNTPKLQRNNDGSNQTISDDPGSRNTCYSGGTKWADLGNWQNVLNALQISGVMRVDHIPEGYHISDKVPVGPHCYVYEVGVKQGHAYTSKAIYNKGLEMVYSCTRGGRNEVRFSSAAGEITGTGWVKGDPQRNKDCSGE